MHTFIRPALVAMTLALAPAAAFAQSAPATTPAPAAAPAASAADSAATGGRPLAACRADAEKYCAGKTKRERRDCLDANADKLSAECKTARADIEGKAKAMREACKADVQSHCASAGKGKGGEGIVQCLVANEAKLSAACATAFKARYPKG